MDISSPLRKGDLIGFLHKGSLSYMMTHMERAILAFIRVTPVFFCTGVAERNGCDYPVVADRRFDQLREAPPLSQNQDTMSLFEEFISHCEKHSPDRLRLLHALTLEDGQFYNPLKQRLDIPFIVSVSDNDLKRKSDDTFNGVHALRDVVDLFIAHSKQAAVDLKNLGCPGKKIIVYPGNDASLEKIYNNVLKTRFCLECVCLDSTDYEGIDIIRERGKIHLFRPDFTLDFINIEPNNTCTLGCPLCPTGRGEIPPKPDMPLDSFKAIVDQIRSPLILDLFNFGESLLHPRVFEMVAYAAKKGHRVRISSNLSFLSSENLPLIIHSGLSEFIACVDGITQQTYGAYRKGGSLLESLKNLRYLCDMRNTQGRGPLIQLQFIAMSHNEQEIPNVERMASDIGVDQLRIKAVNGPPHLLDGYLPASRYCRIKGQRGNSFCNYPWRTMAINCDGEVMPCCYAHHNPAYSMGNAFRSSLQSIWWGKKFREFRKHALLKKETIRICRHCDGHLNDNDIHYVCYSS